MASSDIQRLPSELLIMIFKHAALDGWLGSNAVCNLDILGITPYKALHETTYHMHSNGFLNILKSNGIHKVSTEGRTSARDALRKTQPLYVLLYHAHHYASSLYSPRPPMPPAIPRSIMTLPGALLPSEAFVNILSESFASAKKFLKVIAGVFGPRVKRIYLMHPHHRFTWIGMTEITDLPTGRKYAYRASPQYGYDKRSLTYSAALLFAPGDRESITYRPDKNMRPELFENTSLDPSNARVVTSQATGGEFAEIWRQGLSEGQKRIQALQRVPFFSRWEFGRLRDIVINILLTSKEIDSVLPDLESISLMTVSKTIRRLPGGPRTSFSLV
ncbi:hypothetical protein N0V93_007557 [Gnomoniopsis smithogilvyi]|uniref:Uncharacterized protein n=1 Tax=Gnomoniopsis smithogilvyi TaxID=1191159 RepID=A0A9W8YS22_9PEZI|nr:hypothetical protein N0V93_007557 [Gnomoniopsis smithogilvyi]